jgi:hypothetical protein
MSTKALRDDGEVPVGMRRVCQRFERWRRGHKARLPIPEKLWASAAQAAREHGVFRTAKILRLEYGKLKRMAETGLPPRQNRTKVFGQERKQPKMFGLAITPSVAHHEQTRFFKTTHAKFAAGRSWTVKARITRSALADSGLGRPPLGHLPSCWPPGCNRRHRSRTLR